MNKWRPSGDESPWTWGELAYLCGRSGRKAEACATIEKLQRLNRDHHIDPLVFVTAYMGMSDKEIAFVWLEKAFTEHSEALTALKVNPVYDPLRSDPRFENLLQRMKLSTNRSARAKLN